MEARLIALKLYLDELNVGSDIATVDDRKRIQKAVYLGQASGADLGYSYGWYLMGPYSTALTRDYYDLSGEIESSAAILSEVELREQVAQSIKKIIPIMEVPSDVTLSKEQWLELLASYHFLICESKMTEQEADEKIKSQKPTLHGHISNAKAALKKVGLLN